MRKLSWKLIGAMILVVFVSVGLMAFLTNISTESDFRQFLMQGEGTHIGQGSGLGQQLGLTAAQNEFLEQINFSLVIAGLAGAAGALLIGAFLTNQLTGPLRKLARGAQKIASGELSYRVDVSSKDEIGELAGSFNTMASSLEVSEKSRRRLTNDIAHELRTPLTIIEGTVNGIIDGVFQSNEEHLGNIKEQSVLLATLVNDLKDLSMAESGQLKLDISEVEIVELIKRKIEHSNVIAKEKGVSLDLKADEDEITLKADRVRLEQVITNLLTNAIRHTPSGGNVTIAVGINKENFDKLTQPHVLLKVTDTGEGIHPKHLPHIFDRFYRVGLSRDRSEGGTGLGLAIVKQMVEEHKGEVWVDSETGKGSTFYVALP